MLTMPNMARIRRDAAGDSLSYNKNKKPDMNIRAMSRITQARREGGDAMGASTPPPPPRALEVRLL